MHDQIFDAEFNLNGRYNIFRCDRNPAVMNRSRGGGVMVCVKTTLNSKLICAVSNYYELLIVRVASKKTSFLVVCVYLPPQADVLKYSNLCSEIENALSPYDRQNLLVCGDFNLPEWSEAHANVNFIGTPQMNEIVAITSFLGLTQINDV